MQFLLSMQFLVLGISITYIVQDEPNGIAQAFILAESFLNQSNVTFILGDNIFYGHGVPELLTTAQQHNSGATIFGYHVQDPERYGVATCNNKGLVTSLEEKPQHPKSNLAVTGLYIYDHNVSTYAKTISPSARGELEITELNNYYLAKNKLHLNILGRGTAWLDTGTQASLFDASRFVEVIENRQGLKIACLEEIAFRKGFISKSMLIDRANSHKNDYGSYLNMIAEECP